MKIIIGADLVPTDINFDLFINGDAQALVGKKVKEALDNADFRIFNLELALTDKDTPIKKAGPNIAAPTACIAGYKALGVDLLSLSNNHMLDHGYEGYVSTFKTLDEAGIAHVGAGDTKEEAKKPFFFEKEGKKIGVYACCEHEFSWVEDYGFGANGFDPLESLDDIVEAKKQCDYLIVLYHGGKEHYAYPSPHLQKVCRKIAEKGADIVLCQHTHCVGTEEDYKGCKIIYGQGNFVFARNYAHVPTWGQGFVVEVEITDDGVKYNYIPYVPTEKGLTYDESGEILKGLAERSKEIQQPGFIREKFDKMAMDTVIARYIQHMIKKPASEIKPEDLYIALFHFAECDVHYECLLTGVRGLMGLGRFGEFKDLNANKK